MCAPIIELPTLPCANGFGPRADASGMSRSARDSSASGELELVEVRLARHEARVREVREDAVDAEPIELEGLGLGVSCCIAP
jgi:hypothetical protein